MTLAYVTRPGTTDADAVMAVDDDEYRILDRSFQGWAIDVGAYIGTVGISLAQRNAGLQIIAIEAVPENADICETNVRNFGLTDRMHVVRAWAGSPNDLVGMCHYGYSRGVVESDGYIAGHRFVGNAFGASRAPQFSVELPAISLDALMAEYRIAEVELIKIDCEGCEWGFLDTPAVAKVKTIVGEYHGGTSGQDNPIGRLHELLDATHVLTIREPTEVVIGLFEATRRV